ARAARVRGAEQRPEIPRVRDPPERERQRRQAAREIVPAVDADHARRMGERRVLGEQLRRDVLARHEQLDRLDPCLPGRVDEVLALGHEEPELVAPAPVGELADELELLVVAGDDQAAVCCSSADFACCAMAPKAAGSLTARSARTFRSSVIPALRQPATNWLYESPFARAAALMRMIQSRRNARFRFFRSRYA